MYFGIGYAVNRVNSDNDLAGLIITGTGDVFAPGGDLGGGGIDHWIDFGSTLSMEAVLPFDALRLGQARGLGGQRTVPGRWPMIAMCNDIAVVSDRATFRVPELFRGYR